MFLMKFLLLCENFLLCFRGSEAIFGLGDVSEGNFTLYELVALLIFFTLFSIKFCRYAIYLLRNCWKVLI